MNLEEFLKKAKSKNLLLFRAHLEEPGFAVLYVRYTKRYINDEWVMPVLDIASVEVPLRQRCKGRFDELIKRLRRDHPELHLYIENVLTIRFEKKLEAMGFQNLGGVCPCFYMPPQPKKGTS